MMTWQNHRVEVAGALEGETVVDVETAYNYNILPRLRSDHGPVCAERSDWVGGGINTYAYVHGNSFR